ncbi:MAG: transposase [Chloroflexia bacterium]
MSAYNPELHHRRSIRLRGYDYTQSGAYYITVCTQDRLCLFGDIDDGVLTLNRAVQMVRDVWDELPLYYPDVEVDAIVVMPNHIHGTLVLLDQQEAPRTGTRLSLPDIVARFKSLTTTLYRKGVYESGWQPFPGKLWQRDYYEHIIRGEDELNKVREYIYYNPARWHQDENNPDTW